MRRLCKTVYMDLYSPAAGGMTARSAPARNERAGGERIRLLRPAQSGETAGQSAKRGGAAKPKAARLRPAHASGGSQPCECASA